MTDGQMDTNRIKGLAISMGGWMSVCKEWMDV